MQTVQGFVGHLGYQIDVPYHLLVAALMFLRIILTLTMVPFLGSRPLPAQARMVLAVALTVLLYGPVLAATPNQIPVGFPQIFLLFTKEILFGLLMGFMASLVFYGFQAAGTIVDDQRQLANAVIFNPSLGSQASIFGVFYFQFAIVVFLVLGGHRIFLEGLAQSFATVPLLSVPTMTGGWTGMLDLVVRLSAQTFVIAMQISAPVLVSIFLADIILGLTNRVAPMVNVFDMGFNIKGYVGNLIAYLSLPLVFLQMKTWFLAGLDGFRQLIQYFMISP